MTKQEIDALNIAVQAAIANDWDKAHQIAQDSSLTIAHWIHAVLHKIEGDVGNSRYWYARAHRQYEEYADPIQELRDIAKQLQSISL